jgi:hypothetical protein
MLNRPIDLDSARRDSGLLRLAVSRRNLAVSAAHVDDNVGRGMRMHCELPVRRPQSLPDES